MTRRTDAERIDARGLKCPWPVLRAARAMRGTQAIVLLADDPVARVDVPALAQAHGWHLAMTEQPDHIVYEMRKAQAES